MYFALRVSFENLQEKVVVVCFVVAVVLYIGAYVFNLDTADVAAVQVNNEFHCLERSNISRRV